MSKEIVKEYTNGDLTVVWKPAKCIHAGICVNTLPQVYDPKAKPWIKAENATIEELQAQINQCPSGALSYYMKGEQPVAAAEATPAATKVEIFANGPLVVHGTLSVTDAEGHTTQKENRTFFCRCGQSANKPYCDGTHKKVGFEG